MFSSPSSQGALGSRAAAARIPSAAPGSLQRAGTGIPEQQAAASASAQSQQAKLAQLLKMKAEGKLTPQQEAALEQFQAQQARLAAQQAQAQPAGSTRLMNLGWC